MHAYDLLQDEFSVTLLLTLTPLLGTFSVSLWSISYVVVVLGSGD